MDQIKDRFLRYVKIDSQSDPESQSTPSTEKQWKIAQLISDELRELGLEEVTLDDKGYIMATIPSNVEHEVPVIGFISHYDTSPDYSGKDVKPQIHENYDGTDLVLSKDPDMVLSPSYFEDLLLYKGQTLITTDGSTLLGADDKAGIAEIVTAMEYLLDNPEIKHGKIRIGFTPDEEIGRGAHHFDVEGFGAAWAYTLDGSQVGELEYENFNAAAAKVVVRGKSVHPGYAKGKMINSMLIANDFISGLPKKEIPQETEGYEGFFHLHGLQGSVEETRLDYIIRDHDMELFKQRKEKILSLASELNDKYGEGSVQIEVKDQYLNMKEKVEPVMHIVEVAREAMLEVGVTPLVKAIRGGTDGSQLSYMGLPCPNIFAGGHNFHGPYEYVPLESMLKAAEVIVKICEKTAERAASESK